MVLCVSSTLKPMWVMFWVIDFSLFHEVKWRHPLVKVCIYDDSSRYA
jgi:hypothetical protein